MSLLPIFLKLDKRPGLLVGAGTVALDKIGSLLQTGLRLRVVAPRAHDEVRGLAAEGKLEWIERTFEPADLETKLRLLLAMSEPDRDEFRRRALERVAQLYSWDAVTAAYERLLEFRR